MDDEQSFAADAGAKLIQWTVGQDAAVADYHYSLAESFYVVHVVCGEDDCDAALPVEAGDEVAEGELGHGIQSDGRLVEEENRGGVQQRGGEIATHTLSKAQLSDGSVEEGLKPESFYKLVAVAGVLGLGYAVDVAQQIEGLDDGQVPP